MTWQGIRQRGKDVIARSEVTWQGIRQRGKDVIARNEVTWQSISLLQRQSRLRKTLAVPHFH